MSAYYEFYIGVNKGEKVEVIGPFIRKGGEYKLTPILTSEVPELNEVILVFMNASSPIVSIDAPKLVDMRSAFRLLSFLNAASPIFVSQLSKTSVCNRVQSEKASACTCLTQVSSTRRTLL